MTCKNDCLHYEICSFWWNDEEKSLGSAERPACNYFAARSEYVHLLCNIGDVFFRTIPWRNTIDECMVSSLTQKADKTWKIRLTSGVFRTTFEITINDIGKTVFLTREEAEKILKEKNNES